MLVLHICKEVIWLFGLILTSLHLKQFPSVTVLFLSTVRSGKVLLTSTCLKAVLSLSNQLEGKEIVIK